MSVDEELEFLTSIEQEFEELKQEIDRISTLPQGWAEEQVQQLLKLQKEWKEKVEQQTDRPPWLYRVDVALADAIEHVIRQSHAVDVYGTMSFRPGSETITEHGAPVIQALLTGLQETINQKLAGVLKVTTRKGSKSTPSGLSSDCEGVEPSPTQAGQIIEAKLIQTSGAGPVSKDDPNQVTIKLDVQKLLDAFVKGPGKS